jgi:hypothetical protein
MNPGDSAEPGRKMPTRAEFRRFLNEQDTLGPATWGPDQRYRNRKRKYGDYIWHQDREKFEVEYQAWLKERAR